MRIPPRGLLQRDSDIHRLSFRGGEPLDHDVVGPGGEGLTKPVAALIAPVNLHLTALEIDRAEIVLDRRGFRKIKTHQECRDCGVRLGIPLDGALLHFLESEFHGFAVFPVQHHLPHLREYVRDLGSLEGPLPRHQQAFVVEKDLLRVRIARQLDIHRPIAGGEPLAERRAGRDTAKAPPRHNLPLEPFRQRHRRDLHSSRLRRFREYRRLGQEFISLHAAKIVGGTVLLPVPLPDSDRDGFWGLLSLAVSGGSNFGELARPAATVPFLRKSLRLIIPSSGSKPATTYNSNILYHRIFHLPVTGFL